MTRKKRGLSGLFSDLTGAGAPGLGVGDIAPDLPLKLHTGETVGLHDFVARGPTVLYFYPKDETRGCTAEACGFRDAYEDLQEAGAQVVGVSFDSAADHQAFAERHRLPFPLATDDDRALLEGFGVPLVAFRVPGRVTFVLDTRARVHHVFNSQLGIHKHVQDALEVVRGLQQA